MATHQDRALDAAVMVSIVLEALRHHRQLQRRMRHLDPLRRLLVSTSVEYLTNDRLPVPNMLAIMRETLDGSDTSVRKTIASIRQLAEQVDAANGATPAHA
jgi:hypothetical protein